MPYILRKIKDGYKVCKKNEPKKCFSNNPLTKEKATRQMKAIYANELDGGLKPLTARVGGKVLLKKELINKYFPEISTYKNYVEPFVGAGAVYFYKNQDNKKEVINDIDPKIYQILKGFQKYDATHLREDLNGDYTQDDFQKIKESKPSTEYKKFLKTYLLYRLSYFGLGETYGKPRINSKFEGYTERLNNVTILNEDFRKVIGKYNNKDTFFYLDPPVSNSSTDYKYSAIDIYDLIPILKSIKGLFCLTYANTSIKKELFKGFKVFTINTKYVGEKSKGGQSKKVKEYIITNYDPINKIVGGCFGWTCLSNQNAVAPAPLPSPPPPPPPPPPPGPHPDHNPRPPIQPPPGHPPGYIEDNPRENTSDQLPNREMTREEVVRLMGPPPRGHRGPYSVEDYARDNNITIKKQGGNIERVVGGDIERVIGGCATCGMGGSKPSNHCSGCMGKCGKGMIKFHKQLEKVGLTHDKYMKQVKLLAKDTGYDPSKVHMSEDEDHKCVYHSPDGDVYFGKVGYGDFIIYSWLEKQGEEDEGFAEMKRNAYVSRASNIKGNWKNNKYSPNNLAINLLWAGNI